MSQGQRTPGPIPLFVLFRGASTANYLGTCITAPESEDEKFKIEVMNDLSGRSTPFQLVQDGEKWMVYATMNRFDMKVIEKIRALESGGGDGAGALNLIGNTIAGPTTLTPGLGSESATARGTLVIGVSDFQLIALNSYYGTPSAGLFVGGVSDLPYGRMYYSCNMRKYKESTVGSRVLDVAMAFECQNVYNQATRGFNLYTEDPSKFPSGASLSNVT